MSNSIWKVMHPDFLSAGSDYYYERLVSRIKESLTNMPSIKGVAEDSDLIFDFVSKMTVGYLEDKASGFGVWDAFISLNEERYGKKLPFYELGEDYQTDSINYDDVRFIVWMALSVVGSVSHRVILPTGLYVEVISKEVYRILAEVWEEAPEATRITEYIDKCLVSQDWLKQRSISEWLALNCYLTSVPDLLDDIENDVPPVSNVSPSVYRYAQRALASVSYYLRPLGVRSQEYISVMARNRGEKETARRMKSLRHLGMTVYKILADDGKYLTVEAVCRQVASSPWIGEVKKIAVSSFSEKKGIKIGGFIACNLVEIDNYCELNGMMISLNSDFSYKEDRELQVSVSQLDELKKRSEKTLEKNDNDRLAYFGSWEAFYDFFDLPSTLKPINGNKISEEAGLTCYIGDYGNNLLSYTAGVYIKDKANPFYREKIASKPGEIIGQIAEGNIGYEIAVYAARNGMLSDANLSITKDKEEGKRVVQDNLLFWIDFYHSKLSGGKD